MRVSFILWDRNVLETVPDHDTHAPSILGDVGGLETDVDCVHVVADTKIDDLSVSDACCLAVEHAQSGVSMSTSTASATWSISPRFRPTITPPSSPIMYFTSP